MAFSIVVGIGIGGSAVAAFAVGLSYVSPAGPDPATATLLRPVVDGRWLKAPFDIARSQECLAQSTVTLRRWHDYGPPLGRREDVVVLGLYNTTLTGLGLTPVMLWFRLPDGMEPGMWEYVGKTEDDCGGLFNVSTRRPRTTRIAGVEIGARAP